MKIKIEKNADVLNSYWLIKDENDKEIMSYCRETSQTDERTGGYTYQELLEKIKKHKEWEL
jgi:autonomous glycyl radical cofactor GrcA